MNESQRSFQPEDIKKILIIKQFIRELVINTDLKTKIHFIIDYMRIIRDTIKYVSLQLNITNEHIIKTTEELIISKTVRGYLFPSSYKKLLLELIQILEFIILTSTEQPNITQ